MKHLYGFSVGAQKHCPTLIRSPPLLLLAESKLPIIELHAHIAFEQVGLSYRRNGIARLSGREELNLLYHLAFLKRQSRSGRCVLIFSASVTDQRPCSRPSRTTNNHVGSLLVGTAIVIHNRLTKVILRAIAQRLPAYLRHACISRLQADIPVSAPPKRIELRGEFIFERLQDTTGGLGARRILGNSVSCITDQTGAFHASPRPLSQETFRDVA